MFEEFGVDSDQVFLHGFVAKIKYNKRNKLWQVAKIDGKPSFNERWTQERYKQYEEFLNYVKQVLSTK